jgi:hypothetical protein
LRIADLNLVSNIGSLAYNLLAILARYYNSTYKETPPLLEAFAETNNECLV